MSEVAGEAQQWAPSFVIGLHDGFRERYVSNDTYEQVLAQGFDMLTTPVTNERFRHRVEDLVKETHSKLNLSNPSKHGTQDIQMVPVPPLAHDDTYLAPGDFTSHLLGVTSDWIDICSPDPLVSGVSKQVLLLEVQYAAFCGLDHIVVHGPRLYYGDAAAAEPSKFARAIQACLDLAPHTNFYLKIPMFDHPDVIGHASDTLITREEYLDHVEHLKPNELHILDRWDVWNTIRTACKYSSRLSLALSVPKHIPDLALVSRWFSEPVRIVILEDSAFLRDGRQNPGLSRPSREFLMRIMRLKLTPWIMIWDVGTVTQILDGEIARTPMDLDPTPSEAATASPPLNASVKASSIRCLSHLRQLQQDQPSASDVERYGSGYQDYLQVPLQPLTDNLESMTYEVFEKDPVKYDLYERAIGMALRDWKIHKKPTSHPDGRVVVAVAGAGRGPLVTRAMQASHTEGVPIDMWAVEKNPNAFVLLQKHNEDPYKWNHMVKLVQSDMRSWSGPYKVGSNEHMGVDILITELLGSFADNELSPECLDGILHHLSPQGISIPMSYTAFLTPIAAPKIHADIMSRHSWDTTAPETPAVVWLHSIDYLSYERHKSQPTVLQSPSGSVSLPPVAGTPTVLPVWTFHHGPQKELPIKTTNKHNERFARLTFRCKHRGVCHGFGGYFESVLYPGVELSINPNTIDEKSQDMISWFPIFFPLKAPIYIPDNTSITSSFWRHTDGTKVWYEWMAESWMLAPNHQRVKLQQSEMHSSIKNGCLM